MLGFTGVLWYPRGATINSLNLDTGAGPIPLTAASAAWTELAAALGAASAGVAAVTAQLAPVWEGLGADMAFAKFAPFAAWLGETAEHAGEMAFETGGGAAAYTTAFAIMPTLAEIAAVRAVEAASLVAGAASGGALAGAGAACEAAEHEMDVRAAVAMNGYEAASTVLAFPRPFNPAPPIVGAIAHATGGFDPVGEAVNAAQNIGSAIQGAGGSTPSIPAEFVSQAGNAAATAASSMGEVAGSGFASAGQVMSAGWGGAATSAAVTPSVGMGVGGLGVTGVAAGLGGTGITATSSTGGMTMPEGWPGFGGTAGAPGSSSLPGAVRQGPTTPGGALGAAEAEAVESSAVAHARGAGSPLAATRGYGLGMGEHDDEGEHDAAWYLRKFEHFTDGRVVVPAVIGAVSTDD